MTRVVGLISGTSVDGIDASLTDISGAEFDLKVELVAGATYPYPAELREKILAVCAGERLSMAEFAQLDEAIAEVFAFAALEIQKGYPPAELIGSHGQTVYHRPSQRKGDNPGKSDKSKGTSKERLGYSLQLGRGATIANLTGTTVVSNFRVADIAAGGQGAPLVAKVDACLLSHPERYRCVQNIGGIGNVAYLPPTGKQIEKQAIEKQAIEKQIQAWDTGPGNSLLDLAVHYLTDGKESYDRDGAWAATGTTCDALLDKWLEHPFFQELPPKSTGREMFGFEYFQKCLEEAIAYELDGADLLATLTEFTAASIAQGYSTFLPVPPDEVFLCGGGSRNSYLRQRLAQRLGVPVLTTNDAGMNADFKEAIAFAVLAYWRQRGIPGNLPQCTGASQPVLMGEVNKSFEF